MGTRASTRAISILTLPLGVLTDIIYPCNVKHNFFFFFFFTGDENEAAAAAAAQQAADKKPEEVSKLWSSTKILNWNLVSFW